MRPALDQFRRFLPQIDSYLCWWGFEKYGHTFDDSLHTTNKLWNWDDTRRSVIGRLSWSDAGPRLLSELLSHYTQCSLMLLMAAERYILTILLVFVSSCLSFFDLRGAIESALDVDYDYDYDYDYEYIDYSSYFKFFNLNQWPRNVFEWVDSSFYISLRDF